MGYSDCELMLSLPGTAPSHSYLLCQSTSPPARLGSTAAVYLQPMIS